jgi:hypothetical protein
MRLAKLDRGHGLRTRIVFKVIRLVTRQDPPDVVKMLYYRPEFFGARLQTAMRGPSDWSVGARELFAAFTSRLNQCPF